MFSTDAISKKAFSIHDQICGWRNYRCRGQPYPYIHYIIQHIYVLLACTFTYKSSPLNPKYVWKCICSIRLNLSCCMFNISSLNSRPRTTHWPGLPHLYTKDRVMRQQASVYIWNAGQEYRKGVKTLTSCAQSRWDRWARDELLTPEKPLASLPPTRLIGN